MDATDTKARGNRYSGCYQTGLYNEVRTHLSLEKDAPVLRAVQRTGHMPPSPRRVEPSIYPDLIYDRHRVQNPACELEIP